jgi:hypothetical protein
MKDQQHEYKIVPLDSILNNFIPVCGTTSYFPRIHFIILPCQEIFSTEMMHAFLNNFTYIDQCSATGMPPQGYRCAVDFYKKLYICML